MESTDSTHALIVDDEPDVRGALAEFLESQGFHVGEATNGLEALLYVKRHRPGLVLLDIAMPRLGGLDALKRIRKFDPRIAVVVVTGHDESALRREALTLGARAFLPKPIDFDELGRAIRPDESSSAPIVAADASPAASVGGAAGTLDRRGRILVVDDEPEIVSALAELLTGAGYDARTATDGREAVRAVVADAPDIVLLDIEMPGLSGVDALAEIRTAAPEVCVVMLSGITDQERARRTLAFGAFDYIPKPFDVAHLLDLVATAVAHQKLAAGESASG